MASKIRVLIVDDSALMREMVTDFLAASPEIEVVGAAANGRKALEVLESLKPDVITLDVQMPEMDGLATLDGILARRPTPVIMFSSLTQRGANTTLDALDRGALDYVAKPEGGSAAVHAALGEELVRKVRQVAGTDVRRMLQIRRERAERIKARVATSFSATASNTAQSNVGATNLNTTAKAISPATSTSCFDRSCIALGISTGGPPALSTLLSAMRRPTPPIVIVQHMPPDFTRAFAWRLNSISQLEVKEAETGDILRPDCVYVAPGGKHLSLRGDAGSARCVVEDGDPVSGHRPSVDVMMKSAARIFGKHCLGVVMTGMGRDGADGCKAIRTAGGYVLGQDEATSDVYGMNKVAFVEGGVDKQFALDEGATIIAAQAKKTCDRGLVKRVAVGV